MFPGHKIQTVVYLAADGESETDITVVVENGVAQTTYPVTQKTLAVAFGKKGIPMDVYLDDGNVDYNNDNFLICKC